jgi:hypothetical protein
VEIATFLDLSIRRIVALAVLAVFVALPTAALLLRGPSRYKATVNVRMAQFIPANATGAMRDRAETDVQTALQVPQVQHDVAQRAGIPASDVANHLVAVVPPQGTTIKVSFTDRSQQRALSVVKFAAVRAIEFLSQQQVDYAAAVVDAANKGVTAALTKLEAFQASSGAGSAVDQLKALSRQLLALEDRRGLATSAGEAAQIATLERSTQAQLARLRDVVPEYQQLSENFDEAIVGAKVATTQYTEATSALATSSSPSVVTPQSVAPVGKLKRTVIYGFGAGLAAVLVAVAVLAVEELTRRSLPSPSRHTTEKDHYKSLARLGIEPLLARVSPDGVSASGLVLLVPVGVLVSAGLLALLGQGRTTLAFVLAAPVGLIAGILAFTHFEWFLAAMVVVRSSLDSLNVGRGGVDPGVAMGGVFIVAGLLWLAAQRRAGRWIPASRSTWALWAFAAACAISIPTSLTLSGSAVTTTKVIAGVLMFSVLEQYLGQRPDRARAMIVCLFLALIVPAAVGLHQWVTNHGNTYTADVSRVSGTFVHPSSFADFLLFLLPLAALLFLYCRGWARAAMGAVLVVGGGLLVVTYTREAWLAAIVSLGYLGLRARRQVLYAMVGAVLVLLVTVPSVSHRFADLHSASIAPGVPNNSLSWRVGYWKSLVPMANINPATGIGFDAVERVRPEQLEPHNVFVEAYVETGVVGLLALLAVIWCFAGDLRRRLKAAAPGWDRILALGAVSVALGLLAGFPGENLVTQTFVFWYAAVAMTFGFRGSQRQEGAPLRSADEQPGPSPAPATPGRRLVSVS